MSMITGVGLNCDSEIALFLIITERTASRMRSENEEERTRK